MIAGDLQGIMRTIKPKGAALEANEQPIDTGAGAGKCFLDMLGVASSAVRSIRRCLGERSPPHAEARARIEADRRF